MRKQTQFWLLAVIVILLAGCAAPDETPATPPAIPTAGNQIIPSAASADPEPQSAPAGVPSDPDVQDVGQGETVFAFEVTDDREATVTYAVHTDEETVGAALLKLGMIEGDESDFGLYVKAVNGVKADYDTDKAYWAFYVDGEYAMAGVDVTDIEPGKIYAFVYTKD